MNKWGNLKVSPREQQRITRLVKRRSGGGNKKHSGKKVHYLTIRDH